MKTIIFDGKAFATQKEQGLKTQVDGLRAKGKTFHVKTFTFIEDEGSKIYTKLKQQAAYRIGILYEPVEFSLTDDLGYIMQTIREASFDSHTSGIMVQKPTQQSWIKLNPQASSSNPNVMRDRFDEWWDHITSAIDPQKDVDCLTARNLDVLDMKLLPATVAACLHILETAREMLGMSSEEWKQKKIVVIGRSDIVGKPLHRILNPRFSISKLFGKDDLHKAQNDLTAFDIIISATGVADLIKGNMIKEGSIIIDVGSPKGDVERESVESKAAFLTPVPGGVGPVTVACLMENIVKLSSTR